jgi:hypothetical protein
MRQAKNIIPTLFQLKTENRIFIISPLCHLFAPDDISTEFQGRVFESLRERLEELCSFKSLQK